MKFLKSLLLLLFLLMGLPAYADEPLPDNWHLTAEKALNKLQKSFKGFATQPPTSEQLAAYGETLTTTRRNSEACSLAAEQELSGLTNKLEAIGEPLLDEKPDISKRRRELLEQKKQFEHRQAICRLLTLSTVELQGDLQKWQKTLLSMELFRRTAPLWKQLLPEEKPAEAERALSLDSDRFALWGGFAVVLLLPLVMVLATWFRQLAERLKAHRSTVVLLHMYRQRLPWIGLFSALAIGLLGGGALPAAALSAAFSAAMVMAPPLHRLLCGDQHPCPEGLFARLLLLLLTLWFATLLSGVEQYLTANRWLLIVTQFYLVLAGASMALLLSLARRPALSFLRPLRLPLTMLLLVGPGAQLLGYLPLAELLMRGIYGTLLGALLLGLIYYAITHAIEQLVGKRLPLTRKLIALGMFGLFTYWLLKVWEVSTATMLQVNEWFSHGFQIGAITIIPLRLGAALLIFVLLWLFGGWLRRQMGSRWLIHTSLDRGARQSIVTLTSYTITALAVLVALSMAGLDFQNLAIIAGALSVGIGFGLQNIVNNFISGLILLFERPVRPGDWVVIGNTEGYVLKVSIRYTLIQTFDRAEVMVPNSELIANQVTNWTLDDSFGRVIVPVGVAYGSDIQKVTELLLQAARAHPLTITNDPRVSEPRVLFIQFGESSLDLQLRLFIRDIDRRLHVRSDLLFAIEAAFREAGIEIPFPQRVLHMVPEPAIKPQKE